MKSKIIMETLILTKRLNTIKMKTKIKCTTNILNKTKMFKETSEIKMSKTFIKNKPYITLKKTKNRKLILKKIVLKFTKPRNKLIVSHIKIIKFLLTSSPIINIENIKRMK